MNMQEATSIMKADSYKMAALSEDTRNNILVHVKDALIAHKDEIFAANEKDMAAAEENGIAASVKKRLKFDELKLADVTNGIDELIKLPDPVGQIQLSVPPAPALSLNIALLLSYSSHRSVLILTLSKSSLKFVISSAISGIRDASFSSSAISIKISASSFCLTSSL